MVVNEDTTADTITNTTTIDGTTSDMDLSTNANSTVVDPSSNASKDIPEDIYINGNSTMPSN